MTWLIKKINSIAVTNDKKKSILYSRMLINVLISLIIAIVLRQITQYFFNVTPIKGGIDTIDILYFLSYASIRFTVITLFEHYLDGYNTMTMSGPFHNSE